MWNASTEENFFLRAASSASSRANASLSSSTLRSFAAIVTINSFTLEGDGKAECCCGVGGIDDGVADVVDGVGREGSLVGRAIGRVRESLFGIRDEESVRECRFVDGEGAILSVGNGGGGMVLPSRLLCLLILPVWDGVAMGVAMGVAVEVAVVVVRGVDDSAGSGAGANVDVAAQTALPMTEGSIGARSAADERRRISECEAISRCLLVTLDNE